MQFESEFQEFLTVYMFVHYEKTVSNILKALLSYEMFPINVLGRKIIYSKYKFISAFVCECSDWFKLTLLKANCACDFSIIQHLAQIAFMPSNSQV